MSVLYVARVREMVHCVREMVHCVRARAGLYVHRIVNNSLRIRVCMETACVRK